MLDLAPIRANRRYDIDPVLVRASTARKVAGYRAGRARSRAQAIERNAEYDADVVAGIAESKWSRRPESPSRAVAWYARAIRDELTHYAEVRIIELPQPGARFVLVYGDEIDAEVTSGTGPFDSLEKAANWFLGQGR